MDFITDNPVNDAQDYFRSEKEPENLCVACNKFFFEGEKTAGFKFCDYCLDKRVAVLTAELNLPTDEVEDLIYLNTTKIYE